MSYIVKNYIEKINKILNPILLGFIKNYKKLVIFIISFIVLRKPSFT